MPATVNWRRLDIQRTASTVCAVADRGALTTISGDGDGLDVESALASCSARATPVNSNTATQVPFNNGRHISVCTDPLPIADSDPALEALAIRCSYGRTKRITQRSNRDLSAPHGL